MSTNLNHTVAPYFEILLPKQRVSTVTLPYFLALVPLEKQEAPSAEAVPCSSSWVVYDKQVCVCKYRNKPEFQKNKQAQMELQVPDLADVVFSAYSIDVFL